MYLLPEHTDRILDSSETKRRCSMWPLGRHAQIAENDYNLSVSSYVEAEDKREIIDINKLNTEVTETVKRIDTLRADIDEIIKELEGWVRFSYLRAGKYARIGDAEQEKWYFSIVDVVAILTDSPNPRKYWSVLKTRLKKEGSELATNCSQLKMQSVDGKYYKTDVADTEQLLRP